LPLAVLIYPRQALSTNCRPATRVLFTRLRGASPNLSELGTNSRNVTLRVGLKEAFLTSKGSEGLPVRDMAYR